MNRHDRHTLQVMAAVVGVMIVAAIGGGAWLFNTPQGAHWGFERLGAILPGKLEIAEMNGLLRGPMEIHQVVYRTDVAEVTIDTLKIDWQLRELWRRRLEVRALYAANVRWLVGKPGEHPGARDSLQGPLPDVDLPVAILIHKGEIHHLQITSTERDTGLLIDQVNLDASSLKDGFHVKSLVVHSHPIQLEFDGTVVPRGSYPLTLSGRWAYRPPRGPRLAGVGSVTGTLDTLRVIQEMSAPFAGHLDAFLYRPRDRMQMRANVQFTRLDPRDLDPAWPAGTFTGWAHVEGEPDRYRGRGSIAGLSEMTGPARADFELGQDHGTWSLDRVRMTLPRANTVVEGHGTVALDSVATRFDLSTQWTNLNWPLQGDALARSAHGSARLQGSTRDFDLEVGAALAGPQMPPGHWTLDGRGGNGRLAIRTLIADLLDGRITGSGEVAWVPRTSWRLRFDGKHINPGSAWPAWRGQLAFAGTSAGEMSAHGPNGRVLISRLDGTLRNAPIAGAGTITARDGQYALAQAGLTWGPNHVDANGGFGNQWSLRWNLAAPALAAVIPNANGSLHGKGTVQGPAARPHVVATMRGDSLFFGRLHAGTLRIDGDLDLAPHGVVRLDAAVTQVAGGGRSAQRLLLTARGTRDQHEIRTSVVGRLDSLVTVLAGAWNEREWRGQVRALDLLHHVNGTWKLEAPAPLVAGAGKVQLTNLRWASGPSRVALSADWQRFGPWHVDSEFGQMQLALLTPWMPEEMRFTGPLAGHLRAHGDAAGHVWCDADLTPGPGEVAYLGASGKWIPTRFDHAKIEARGGGVGLRASAHADLVGVGTVRATLALPSYGAAISADRQPLRGTLSLHLKDLAIAQGLSHELDATGGQLDTDLHFAGTVGRPEVWGPLHVKNAFASVPRLGVDAKAIDIRATGSQAGQLTLRGSLQSGPGTLTFDGTAALGDRAKPLAKFIVKGERVQAMNTKEMSFLISPDLQLALAGRRIDMTGQVGVPEGVIEVEKNEKGTVIRPSQDVVFRGADTLGSAAFEVHSKIRITVGEKVTFRGFGLDMRPTGTVLVSDEPGLPPMGTGEFTIRDGKYRVYGQEMDVERARLIFGGGPLLNPAIRARAVRHTGDVNAGFIVAGTVQKPDVRIFSDPPMGESQALSYIMFGRPLDRGTLAQGQLLSTMATTMGVRGTNLVAHGAASSVGIEQAKIETGDAFRNASLSLGTHLSPKLYVSYGVGLFETVAALRMRYLVTHGVTIEAESARQNRVDLLYTVER